MLYMTCPFLNKIKIKVNLGIGFQMNYFNLVLEMLYMTCPFLNKMSIINQ